MGVKANFSGVIQATGHGILIDANSKIVSTKTAVAIGGPTFTGGISNAGAISGGYGAPGTAGGPVDAVGATHAAKLRVPVTVMDATQKRIVN